MQPDTIIPDPSNPQSWNRYSYVTNRSINFNDPTGHYGEEVHYSLTGQIAYQEASQNFRKEYGLTRTEVVEYAKQFATEIALADLDVDNVFENPDENALSRPGSCQGFRCGGGGLSQHPAHHWYTTSEAERELRAAKTTKEFGVAMHAYQDSFSHWQKLGKPSTPGAIWDGHAQNQWDTRACKVTPGCNPNKVYVDYYDPKNNSIDREMRDGTRKKIRDFLEQNF